MDVDMMKRQEMCFNCGVKGHIAARCPELKKKRKFFGRRTELERSVEEKPKTFWGEQGVSTDSSAITDSKIWLPKETINDFLSYFGARNYESPKGYSAEWIARRIKEEDKEEAVEILKVWVHQLRRRECTIEKIQELNEMMDDEVIVALKALEEPYIL